MTTRVRHFKHVDGDLQFVGWRTITTQDSGSRSTRHDDGHDSDESSVLSVTTTTDSDDDDTTTTRLADEQHEAAQR
jgi:hypothetical protein